MAPGGNSSTPTSYATIDPSPYPGRSYYRIRQTHIDGYASYSSIATVTFDGTSAISVYPNPTTGPVTVSGLPATASALTADWYDERGMLIVRQTSAIQNGIAGLTINGAPGVYFLKIVLPDGTVTVRKVLLEK